MKSLLTNSERDALRCALMATILLASAALRAEPPTREIITEVDYAKQTSWQQTMLEARRRVRNSATQVELMTGSGYAHRFWQDFPIQTDWLMQDSEGKTSQWKGGLDGKGDLANYLKRAKQRITLSKEAEEIDLKSVDEYIKADQ